MELQKSKTLLCPAWLIQSVIAHKALPYDDFYAICPLKKCTKEYCPEHNLKMQDKDQPPPPKNLSYMSKFAVQRASPLICPNQQFLCLLAVVREARTLDGNERSAMSYARAIGVSSNLFFRPCI